MSGPIFKLAGKDSALRGGITGINVVDVSLPYLSQ